MEKNNSSWSRNTNSRTNRASRTGDFHQIRNIKITENDAIRFNAFIKEELKYYNNLVNALHPRFKTTPDNFIALSDTDIELLGWVATTRVNSRSFYNSKSEMELPDVLEPFREKLTGRDSKNIRILSDFMISVMENLVSKGSIVNNMRRNMAMEILSFYKSQANFAVRSVKVKNNDDLINITSYKSNFQFLETLELVRKRHVQLLNPRVDPNSPVNINVINVKNDNGEIIRKDSLLKTPYNETPIVIENFDMNHDFRWKVMVIHQKKGNPPTKDTPWNIELHNTNANYLLNYRESNNPYASTLPNKKNHNSKSRYFGENFKRNDYNMTTKKWSSYA